MEETTEAMKIVLFLMMRQTKACLNAAGSHLVETEKFMLCVCGGGGERLL